MSVRGFDHVAIPIERVDAMLAGGKAQAEVHFGSDETRFGKAAVRTRSICTARRCGTRASSTCDEAARRLLLRVGTPRSRRSWPRCRLPIVHGPLRLTGEPARALYVRDPDANLLEFIVYGED